MARLIDADALIERLEKHSSYDLGYFDEELDEMIKTQPTAYDVEKVVARLAELNNFNTDIIKSIPYSGNPYLHLAKEEYCKGKIQAYQNAINIVRKGGVE